MQQLQFNLPDEEEIALEAVVQDQLQYVMAEIIRAIVLAEKEGGHDHQST